MSSQRQVLLACLTAFLCFDITLVNRVIMVAGPFEGISLGVVTAQNGLVALGLSSLRRHRLLMILLQGLSTSWITLTGWTFFYDAYLETWCCLLIVQVTMIWSWTYLRRWRASEQGHYRITLAHLLGWTAATAVVLAAARTAWQRGFVPREPIAIGQSVVYGIASALCVWFGVGLSKWRWFSWPVFAVCLGLGLGLTSALCLGLDLAYLSPELVAFFATQILVVAAVQVVLPSLEFNDACTDRASINRVS